MSTVKGPAIQLNIDSSSYRLPSALNPGLWENGLVFFGDSHVTSSTVSFLKV